MSSARRLFSACALALAVALPFAAFAQAIGHLNVPAAQMVHATLGPQAGSPQNQHFFNGYTLPDGTQEPWSSSMLRKQTFVVTDFTILVYRASSSNPSYAESGEIYLADFDASLRGRPLQDQFPLVHYTIPVGEGRVVLQVPIAAGRAFGGYRQPALVNYINPNTVISGRAFGYLLPN